MSTPIAITTGDQRGIGPEVISKGLFDLRNKIPTDKIVIFGNPTLFKSFKKLLPPQWHIWSDEAVFSKRWPGLKDNALNFIVSDCSHIKQNLQNGFLSGRYIELAVQGVLQKKFSGIVTGPIDKKELQKAGFHFDGHTEMLQALCLTPSVTMMLCCPEMRISLVTTHVSIRDVSAQLTEAKILECIRNTHGGLKKFFGINKPKIAVLALNPHASDGGLFGIEENNIILPAIEFAQREKYCVEGPFAADGFFSQWDSKNKKKFDAIVCMYHDQGLIPIKLYDFSHTVNLTLGLPIVRTSVDHGIGLDIKGKNLANPSSFIAALLLARKIVSLRRPHVIER